MNCRKQQGWSMWSLAFTLAIIASIAALGLKIIPLYMDNGTIRSVVKSVEQDRTLSDMSYDEISKKILKKLSINSIRWLKYDDIEFIEEDTHTELRIDYEKRIELVANIDLILTFENHAKLPN